jgi:hypothetical protein
MKTIVTLLLSLILVSAFSQPAPKVDIQIKMAVLAAPEDSRSEAMVYGYSDKGDFIVLRKGSNEMICIADDPDKKGLNVSCYHKDMEPFMARGRELKEQGKSFQEIFDIREEEVKTNKLAMGKYGSTLFVFSASDEDVDYSSGDVKSGNFRYVVYIPFATVESTGLPLKPEAPGMPWIMDPGTHRAHIMINPPKQ